MSHIAQAPTVRSESAPDVGFSQLAVGRQSAVLNSDSEVLLGTTATLVTRPGARPWPGLAVLAWFGRGFTRREHPQSKCLHHERACFETARMSREMDRL
jgi:hypothetical protein